MGLGLIDEVVGLVVEWVLGVTGDIELRYRYGGWMFTCGRVGWEKLLIVVVCRR